MEKLLKNSEEKDIKVIVLKQKNLVVAVGAMIIEKHIFSYSDTTLDRKIGHIKTLTVSGILRYKEEQEFAYNMLIKAFEGIAMVNKCQTVYIDNKLLDDECAENMQYWFVKKNGQGYYSKIFKENIGISSRIVSEG